MAYKRKFRGRSGGRRVRRRPSRIGRPRYRYGARGKSRIAKICRKTIFRMTEPKELNVAVGKTELYHNCGSPASGRLGNFYTLNRVANMPVQGNGDSGRNGDRIYMSGFGVRMLCGQKFDRPNVTWKVIVAVTAKGTTCDMSRFFRTTTSNLLIEPLNTDYIKKILYYKTFKPAKSMIVAQTVPLVGLEASSKEYTFARNFWISRKKQYKFSDDNGTGHDDDDIVMFVGAYDAYGSLITDNIAYFDTYVRVCYRDP